MERFHRKIETPEDLNGLSTAELARIAEVTEIGEVQQALATNPSELIRAGLLRNRNLNLQIREALQRRSINR